MTTRRRKKEIFVQETESIFNVTRMENGFDLARFGLGSISQNQIKELQSSTTKRSCEKNEHTHTRTHSRTRKHYTHMQSG